MYFVVDIGVHDSYHLVHGNHLCDGTILKDLYWNATMDITTQLLAEMLSMVHGRKEVSERKNGCC
jgi:hypothetical protein